VEPDQVDFGLLFDQAWRRLTMLCALYGHYGAEDDVAYRSLRARANEVVVVHRRMRTVHLEHLAVESGVRKPLQGLLGELVLEGAALPAFLPALRGAETVHIGGATTLGLGRLRVDRHEPR
jgi:hypothetical protein